MIKINFVSGLTQDNILDQTFHLKSGYGNLFEDVNVLGVFLIDASGNIVKDIADNVTTWINTSPGSSPNDEDDQDGNVEYGPVGQFVTSEHAGIFVVQCSYSSIVNGNQETISASESAYFYPNPDSNFLADQEIDMANIPRKLFADIIASLEDQRESWEHCLLDAKYRENYDAYLQEMERGDEEVKPSEYGRRY